MDIPKELIAAILENRCVAFVGAGFSRAGNLPTWQQMLVNIIGKLLSINTFEGSSGLLQKLEKKLTGPPLSGDSLDQIAQVLEGEVGRPTLEKMVAEELSIKTPLKNKMEKRLKLLDGIPFRSILTTNYDEFLVGSTPLQASWPEYSAVLRGGGEKVRQTEQSEPHSSGYHQVLSSEKGGKRPVIKLHGQVEDVGASSGRQALVLTRTGYRQLLHHTPVR